MLPLLSGGRMYPERPLWSLAGFNWPQVARIIDLIASMRDRRTTFKSLRSGVHDRLSREPQCLGDRLGQLQPASLFFCELPAAGWCDGVETGLPARIRQPPLRAQPLFVRHALQGRIQRPLFDSQRIVGRLVDSLRDGVAMLRSGASQDLEDQQVECALQPVVRMLGHINSQLCIAGRSIDVSLTLVNRRVNACQRDVSSPRLARHSRETASQLCWPAQRTWANGPGEK